MTSSLNTISLLKLDSRNQAVVNQNKKAYKKANIFITNSEAEITYRKKYLKNATY